MRLLSYILLFITLLSYISYTYTQQSASIDDETLELSDELDDDIDIDDLVSSTEPIDFFSLPENNDLTTVIYFPDYNQTTSNGLIKLPSGTTVTMLVGVHNDNSINTYNISYLQCALVNYYDYTHYIQNFSLITMNNAISAPYSDLTLTYQLYIDPSLEAAEYGVTGFILFNNTQNRIYKNTIGLQSIYLYDNTWHILHWETISAWLMFIAIIGGSIYGLLMLFAPKLLTGSGRGGYKQRIQDKKIQKKKQ